MQEKRTGKFCGVGKAVHGLYSLVNLPVSKVISEWRRMNKMKVTKTGGDVKKLTAMNVNALSNVASVKATTLWHWRLGHAPLKKISKTQEGLKAKNDVVCITCPLAKFTRLPFNVSESRVAKTFHMIHMDIWGPYSLQSGNQDES